MSACEGEYLGWAAVAALAARRQATLGRAPLKRALAVKRQAETAMVESPVRESKSNGRIERAIRTWRDQFRTLRHQYERRMKIKMENNGVLSSWLASWAAEVLNRYKVQDSGRTASKE